MTNDEYDASIRAMLQPIEARPETERAEQMAAELDIDTYTRIDYYIALLETGRQWLPRDERQDLARLLRRWRKEKYGSALTDHEQRTGKAEINP